LDFQPLLKELKSGTYQPIYFLHGKESYFIDAISSYIEQHALSESERAFNQTIVYGKEADHKAVVDAARRYPMMAPRQVVILKEAQEMRGIADLLTYVEKPTDSTVLVICYKHKKFNKFNTKFGKALKKQAVVMESKPLYDNQVPAWISTYLKGKKMTITPKAAELIAENLGTDLSKIANELEKLGLNLPAGAQVDDAAVEKHIGISKDYNIFELQKAIGLRDPAKAMRIVSYFAANPKKGALVPIISSLYNYFSKIYLFHAAKNLPEPELLSTLQLRSKFFLKEYRATARNYPKPKTEQVIGLLKTYDLKSKGVGYRGTGKPESELTKELVWRIMH
jgi:DNA polymerase-3 subunit delta